MTNVKIGIGYSLSKLIIIIWSIEIINSSDFLILLTFCALCINLPR